MIYFAKPDLKFSFTHHGLMSMQLDKDYDKVCNKKELIDFLYKYITIMEETENAFKKRVLMKVVSPLYGMITGKSYQTKRFEQVD